MNNKPTVGRPRKFETPEELVKILQDYFDQTPVEEFTVTGLALLVGSKQLLNDYQDRDEFKDIVTEAKLIVENAYELSLRKNGRTGDIFALKNFNWKDKSESEITGKDGEPLISNITVEFISPNQNATTN